MIPLDHGESVVAMAPRGMSASDYVVATDRGRMFLVYMNEGKWACLEMKRSKQ